MNARLLRSYLTCVSERGHNAGGISKLYRAVRAFLHWDGQEYERPQFAASLERVPSPSLSTEPLDPIPLEHVTAMLSQCTPRTFTGEPDRAVLYVLPDAGIRHQELTNLTVDDISVDAGSVLVRTGKGGKSRTALLA